MHSFFLCIFSFFQFHSFLFGYYSFLFVFSFFQFIFPKKNSFLLSAYYVLVLKHQKGFFACSSFLFYCLNPYSVLYVFFSFHLNMNSWYVKIHHRAVTSDKNPLTDFHPLLQLFGICALFRCPQLLWSLITSQSMQDGTRCNQE